MAQAISAEFSSLLNIICVSLQKDVVPSIELRIYFTSAIFRLFEVYSRVLITWH